MNEDDDKIKIPFRSQSGKSQRWEFFSRFQNFSSGDIAEMFESADRGYPREQYKFFEHMLDLDGELAGTAVERMNAIFSRDFSIVAPADATWQEKKHLASLIDIVLDILDWEDVLLGLLDAVLKGFSALEFSDNNNRAWIKYGGFFRPAGLVARPQEWFTFDTSRPIVKLYPDTPLKEGVWLTHFHFSRITHPVRAGLLRPLATSWLLSNYAILDLSQFVEIYGLPARIAETDGKIEDDDFRKLEDLVENLGHDTSAVLPKGVKLYYMEAAKGNEKPFASIRDWGAYLYHRLVLGRLKEGVAHNIIKGDIKQLGTCLSKGLLWPIWYHNHFGNDFSRCPRMVFNVILDEDIGKLGDALYKLSMIDNLEIPASWAHNTIGIPRAQPGEPILRLRDHSNNNHIQKQAIHLEDSPKDTTEDSTEDSTESASLTIEVAKENKENNVFAQEFVEDIDDNELLIGILRPLFQKIEQSHSYEEIDLDEIFTQMDPTFMQSTLTGALFYARMKGQLGIID